MLDTDRSNLLAILDSSKKILRYTADISNAEELYRDEETLDAVLMNFVIIGECTTKLSEALISDKDFIPWKTIKPFRNIIAHDYFGVDPEVVWQIIQNHLPALITNIQLILDQSTQYNKL